MNNFFVSHLLNTHTFFQCSKNFLSICTILLNIITRYYPITSIVFVSCYANAVATPFSYVMAKNLSKCFIKFAYKVRLSTSTTCSRRRMARDCRLKFTFASFHPIFCFWSSSEVHKSLTHTLSHAMKYIRESEWVCIGLRVCMQGFYFTKDRSSRSFLLYCNRQVAFGRRRRRKLGIW